MSDNPEVIWLSKEGRVAHNKHQQYTKYVAWSTVGDYECAMYEKGTKDMDEKYKEFLKPLREAVKGFTIDNVNTDVYELADVIQQTLRKVDDNE